MLSPWEGRVIAVYHDTLPHWVVDYGCYAVTVRCAESLPHIVVMRLQAIQDSLRRIPPQDEEAQRYRRQLFHTLETFLDEGSGFAPFRDSVTACKLHENLCEYDRDGLRFSHFVIMPNHVHLLTDPVDFGTADAFKKAWRNFKARTGRAINGLLDREGPFWQTGWYDRWVRNEIEAERWRQYFRKNPVKAGLCREPADYPWLR